MDNLVYSSSALALAGGATSRISFLDFSSLVRCSFPQRRLGSFTFCADSTGIGCDLPQRARWFHFFSSQLLIMIPVPVFVSTSI